MTTQHYPKVVWIADLGGEAGPSVIEHPSEYEGIEAISYVRVDAIGDVWAELQKAIDTLLRLQIVGDR